MEERKGVTTFRGNPLTLVGPEIKAGDKAPAFSCLDAELKPVCLGDFKGKTILIASVPSLDTKVCSVETIRFNKEVERFSADRFAALTISMDLPFAQDRFCATEGIKNLTVASDHRDAAFGKAYGTLIRELRLLSRAVFVIDGAGKVLYVEYVKENTTEPDYASALAVVNKTVGAKAA